MTETHAPEVLPERSDETERQHVIVGREVVSKPGDAFKVIRIRLAATAHAVLSGEKAAKAGNDPE